MSSLFFLSRSHCRFSLVVSKVDVSVAIVFYGKRIRFCEDKVEVHHID